MKKVISLFVCLIMIAAMAISSVSAAGQILFKDEFNSMDNNDWIWDPEATHFVVDNGVLKGDDTARVHQTEYRPDYDGIRLWDYFSCKVDVRITDYADSSSIGPGLWWRDYNTTFEQEDGGETETGEIWEFQYDQISNTCSLKSDYFTNNNIEPIVVEAPGTVKVGPDEEPTTFSIGWRIQPGRIDCYFNDQKVITCTNVPADMGTIRKSPILLTNAACYIEFDNFTVATYDYNLFNEKPDENVNGGDNVNGGNATEIVTAIETDENGETVIVTKVVADTNKNTPNASNGGSGTGDMIVVVVAVMAVSAAGAVILAKRRKEN